MDCMNRNPEEMKTAPDFETLKEQKVKQALEHFDNRLRHLFNCAYEAGRGESQDDHFKKGLCQGIKRAWELLEDIASMDPDLRHKIFGTEEVEVIIKDMTYDEAYARASDYYIHLSEMQKLERSAPIKAGDYVIDESGRPGIVTNADTAIHILYDDGKTHKWNKNARIKRTGASGILRVEQDVQEG